jgi:hypothetical protein
MNRPLYLDIRDSVNAGDLGATFIEKMGWGAPTGGAVRTQAAGQFWQGRLIANLKGFNVILIDLEELPDTAIQREVDKAFFKQFAERITIFKSPTLTSWLWPRKRASGFLAPERYEYATGSIPDYLAQKLSAISFSITDHAKGITLGQVRDKVRGQFDTSAVTKKFYEEFKKQHESLTSQIHGLPDSEAHSYSSILLNRLMFIYFLQKKEFINGDANYLRTCLEKLQKLNSEIKFYSFYKDLLRTLFFDGLNRQPHEFTDPKIAEILGDPPYINGGIFGASEIEQAFEIEIPDKAFEDIFNLFDSYRWHLDTSPTGNSNEINPEVIGYIFEQYINYTANGRKEKGAYYTPQDVCGHMAKSTVVPLILESLQVSAPDLFQQVREEPYDFIFGDMLHGWNSASESWMQVPAGLEQIWNDDPVTWHLLDEAPNSSEMNLTGESWVETFHRRQRVESIISSLQDGALGQSPNDYVTYPLDGTLLISRYLSSKASLETLEAFWAKLSKFSVIDPTCGSGAFLFAALEVLEDIYGSLLDGLERIVATQGRFSDGYSSNEQQIKSNRRYFIRRSIALNNLYGTDLMPDAIETAKLRLFLSLVACLESGDELEPLPDLDFNFKVANLVVGFYDEGDAGRISQDLFIKSSLDDLRPQIQEFKSLHEEFNEMLKSGNHKNIHVAKSALLTKSKKLRQSCNAIYADAVGVEDKDLSAWVKEHVPFHWFIEFPEIIQSGGFDVVIGNPPYIKSSDLPLEVKATLVGYHTKDCPDFYAVCYERSIQLLKPMGWHSMIVMISLACGGKFEPLRDYISRKNGGEWWSTYGKRPDSLFAGIQVRNTILTLGPRGNQHSTSHNIFTKQIRSSLFSTLEMVEVSRKQGGFPARGGLANSILEKILNSQRSAPVKTGKKLYTLLTASYWYPILPNAVPIVNVDLSPSNQRHSRLLEIELHEGESEENALSLLGGKMSYLYWSSTGNDMDSSNAFGEAVLGLLKDIGGDEGLSALSKQVALESREHYFASKNAKKYYLNLRWSSCRAYTDQFDRKVLDLLGLLDEWRNLNIWYRQTMRSSGENSNGIQVSKRDVETYEAWYEANYLN